MEEETVWQMQSSTHTDCPSDALSKWRLIISTAATIQPHPDVGLSNRNHSLVGPVLISQMCI